MRARWNEFFACEKCRTKVEPNDPDVVRAVQQTDVTAMGDAHKQYVDGLGVFFHDRCYPRGSRRYRRVDP